MRLESRCMIANKVKLVIWDLDETFWKGTLSEEGIVAIESNIAMVRTLAHRGILNSICSKNDYEQTKAKLTELGIWDFFVFPSISFDPKGKIIAGMIESAALRAENVLFLDDNRLNLEEVKFFNAGIMAAHPDDVLLELLDHKNLAGKPDPDLTRLKQYQFLQKKVEERTASDLSNEEFLRASDIKVAIDYHVEANFDRVLDLINRANQLNYTKRRLETAEDIAAFRDKLGAFGTFAGCVRATDRFGDYGLIGFFSGVRNARKNKLTHFVFSCRTMNMGIEQYIYEMLGRPDVEIAKPVSYGLNSHTAIDWIAQASDGDKSSEAESDRKLVLVGGCDLLQLASYCSTDRAEFVNIEVESETVRYDDPGFILSDRAAIRDCEAIREIPCWTYADASRFDEAVAKADLILVSMWAAMSARYFELPGSVMLGLKRNRADLLAAQRPEWFARNFKRIEFGTEERTAFILSSLDATAARSAPACPIFVIGSYTKGPRSEQEQRRKRFNERCRNHCEQNPARFRFVDVDTVVPPETLVGNQHFSRAGYFAMARHILADAGTGAQRPAMAG